MEVLKWLFENIPEVKTAEFLNARTNVSEMRQVISVKVMHYDYFTFPAWLHFSSYRLSVSED